jgi:transcription termination factor Rho
MSVLGRSELESSPLADLHMIASELGMDGYRRLRKPELIAAILERQGGDGEEEPSEPAAPAPPRRSRGGRRRRGGARDADPGDSADAASDETPSAEEEPAPREEEPERTVEGVVEVLSGGSGFVRVSPPEPSEEDVYVSAAQVRRCDLVSGDTVTGPVRAPRRSERHPSLIRVDTINGVPADEVAAGTPFDELPAAYPSERFALGGEDPTVKAIEWLTPFGRGSRVTITGSARSGKTEALRRLAGALADVDGLSLSVVLAGVRPEEVSVWREGPVEPAAAVSFAASADAQAQAVERAVDQGRRVAARGGNAVVLVDALDGLHPPAARKVLAAARNIVDGGSLTIVATASAPVGGETTVIALDAALTSTGRFPALDLGASGTLRPELLVGDAGAEAIARARAEATGA